MTKLAFSHNFLGRSTGFWAIFREVYWLREWSNKKIKKMTPQTHHCQQLLLVKNVDSTESAPRHYRVSKSPALIGLSTIFKKRFLEYVPCLTIPNIN